MTKWEEIMNNWINKVNQHLHNVLGFTEPFYTNIFSFNLLEQFCKVNDPDSTVKEIKAQAN